MKYYNAAVLLPQEVIEQLQSYIQGAYIYIPAKQQKARWGEKSGYRKELHMRNQAIRKQYQKGQSMESLAVQYYLSIYTIKKIIYDRSTYKDA